MYAIQGTGNGHLSRAMDNPLPYEHADVHILVSGIQGDLVLPYQLRSFGDLVLFLVSRVGLIWQHV